ncbi:restriction endonuclease [Mycobacteroides franklinii]|uniref:Restriction endonuclease n=1 Tax=Mycobacteroides franklinii TaxID=948102 RepID=A0A1S1L6I3_9MYCO|nr:restriction endonuclease [Mycobacteroides franklinii]OHU21361.1 restriction endonuclease [Mycobacteroides franklinii]
MMLRRWRRKAVRVRRRLSRAFVTLIVVLLAGPVTALIVWPGVLVYRNTGDPAVAALVQVAYLASPYAIYLILRSVGWTLRALGDTMARRRYDAQLRRYTRLSGLDEIDEMSGTDFEMFVAARMHGAGWHIETTPASSDYGVDLIATNRRDVVAVQCKRYSKPVGVRAVQEAVAGARHYDCTRSMVVSNQDFTRQAHALAASSRCELIGRDRLPRWLNQSEVSASSNAALPR